MPSHTLQPKTHPSDGLTLSGVKFIQDVTVFGKYGSQLSSTMQDIIIRWDETNKRVVVTSTNPEHGGQEWIHESLIAKTVWK